MNITLPAPAKINLHLHIIGRRRDGMHELDTAFAYTQAFDELHFTDCDSLQITCSLPHLSGDKNLVFQLLHAFRTKYHVKQGLAVHIKKRVPEQSGLGGGSSDAATALLAANDIWNTHISIEEMIEFAAPFGADIPCFLYGRASLARGIGEKLVDYPSPLPEQALLLAWPDSGLSTADVFRHFDSFDRTLTPSEVLDTMHRDLPGLGNNDLEASACSLNPDVKGLLDCMRQQTEFAWMSGSGSACAALFDDEKQATAMAEKLKLQNLAAWVHVGKMIATHPVQMCSQANIGT
jgi:4-diphosphocytidyl-2-C-methyl-D-erythritol kinase